MFSRIIAGFCSVLLLLTFGIAEKSVAQDQTKELKLNLEQFPDNAGTADQNKELKLNLEQFDKTDEQKSTDLELNLEQFDKQESVEKDSDTELELNLDQFEGNSSVLGNSDSQSGNTGIVSPTYNYRHIFIIGGLVFLVFLYYLSRRRKRRSER